MIVQMILFFGLALASLVQAYTGFIYGGPRFAPRLLAELAGMLRRDGFSTVADAVGVDARA